MTLLAKAFKRKLTFTIGFSQARQCDGVIVWNGISHRSRTSGGAARFAYPDPGYFALVKGELASKGVTIEYAQEITDFT